MKPQRRDFLLATTTLGLASLAHGLSAAAAEPSGKNQIAAKGDEGHQSRQGRRSTTGRGRGLGSGRPDARARSVAPILLVYEEGLRRMAAGRQIAPDLLHQSATLVRKFVEEYHEQLEEKHIFPLFAKTDRLVPLVKTLLKQHGAGRGSPPRSSPAPRPRVLRANRRATG